MKHKFKKQRAHVGNRDRYSIMGLGALVLLLIIPDNEAADHVHDGASVIQDEGDKMKKLFAVLLVVVWDILFAINDCKY